MHQIAVYGAMFTGDKNAILPAWWWPWRPDGPYPGENPGLGHPDFNWNMEHFGHMLIDMGYVSDGMRVDTGSIAANTPAWFDLLRRSTGSSLFSCPSGYPPSSTSNDNPADFLGGMAAHLVNPNPYPRMVLMRPWQDRGVVRNTSTTKWYLGMYNVSMNAGSWQWYHYVWINYGYYPIRRWRSPASSVGHIFESAEFGVNENHTVTAMSRTANSWGVGSWGGTYCPVMPHADRTKFNLVYGDGHVQPEDGEHTTKPIPWKWY